jgi:hypothetical protein
VAAATRGRPDREGPSARVAAEIDLLPGTGAIVRPTARSDPHWSRSGHGGSCGRVDTPHTLSRTDLASLLRKLSNGVVTTWRQHGHSKHSRAACASGRQPSAAAIEAFHPNRCRRIGVVPRVPRAGEPVRRLPPYTLEDLAGPSAGVRRRFQPLEGMVKIAHCGARHPTREAAG